MLSQLCHAYGLARGSCDCITLHIRSANTCEVAGDKVTCSQLAFACWLRTKLPNLQDPSTMSDPVFNRLDKQLLQALKFEVLPILPAMRSLHI